MVLLEHILVVSEFLDVFSEQLPELPLDREVEFAKVDTRYSTEPLETIPDAAK